MSRSTQATPGKYSTSKTALIGIHRVEVPETAALLLVTTRRP